MSELAAVVPAASPFWELHRSIVEDDVDDLLEDAHRRRSHATADDPITLLRSAWSAPAQVLAHAAMASDPAAISDRPGVDREVVAMLDGLAEAVQVRDDLARMPRDLAEERPSFPIAVAARAAGLSLQPWPSPAVVLGAMVATGSLGTIFEAARRPVAGEPEDRGRCRPADLRDLSRRRHRGPRRARAQPYDGPRASQRDQ